MAWTIILLVAAVVLVLLAVCCVRALLAGIGPAEEAPAPGPEEGGAGPDELCALPLDEAKAQLYARHLARMLRCETLSNPDDGPPGGVAAPGGAAAPSHTTARFNELRAVLEECYPRIHAACERRLFGDSQLLRWPGRESDRPCVLLMAHLDVVPAASAGWRHPPFGGEADDERVYGRGAIDDKGALCAIFEAVEGLLDEGFAPPCDVYILSSANEEIMGAGAPVMRDWMLAQGVRFGMVVDEGGAVSESPLPGLPGLWAQLGVQEKGVVNLRFTAGSTGGHASVPPRGTPIARLAAFVQEMETKPPFPRRVTPVLGETLRALAPRMSFARRVLCCNRWLFGPVARWWLAKRSPRLWAMMQTTIAFTMASGGTLPNVIPEEASVTANLRLAPHQPLAPSLRAVRRVAEKYGLSVEVLFEHDVSGGVDLRGEAFAYLRGCVQQAFPGALAVPVLVLFGTDARSFAPHCNCTVRFSPYLASGEELAAMHAGNESIGVRTLAHAVHFYELLLRGWK